jgi:hypothetical protein
MQRSGIRKRVVGTVAPLVASGLAIGASTGIAGAATSAKSDSFTFQSAVSNTSVTCTIEGSLRSTPNNDGTWALTAFVRISSSSSSECFDGVAHMTTHVVDGPDGEYDGGGSFVQVVSTTPGEVERIQYEVYFDNCTCYSPTFITPK